MGVESIAYNGFPTVVGGIVVTTDGVGVTGVGDGVVVVVVGATGSGIVNVCPPLPPPLLQLASIVIARHRIIFFFTLYIFITFVLL